MTEYQHRMFSYYQSKKQEMEKERERKLEIFVFQKTKTDLICYSKVYEEVRIWIQRVN